MGFRVKNYQIQTNKIAADDKISIVFLTDLHLAEYGDGNEDLLNAISELKPDLILAGGDMVTGCEGYSVDTAEQLMRRLAGIAPVYSALGNHEKRLKDRPERYGDVYEIYYRHLKSFGVHVLDNASCEVQVKGAVLHLHGLSLGLKHYRRFIKDQLPIDEIYDNIGKAEEPGFHILLAHHPRYAQTYFDWGADLTLSGHIHGGVVRFGEKALISPDFQLFPKYGYGEFSRGEQKLLISSGLGEHTVPFRLFNPKELLYIELM